MKALKLLPLLLLFMLPVAVQATQFTSTNADGSIYTYNTTAGSTCTIIAYAGPPWTVTIPGTINGLTVTSIGSDTSYPVFYEHLTSITIPNSVTSIGNDAFEACYILTNVVIGTNVTSIGTQAFFDCESLTSVIIPDSVTNIELNAFADCPALTNVIIGTNVTVIGEAAFGGDNSLTSVTIPNSVTNIGQGAFSPCYNLASVTIGTNVTSIGWDAFESCTSLTSVTIPNSVTSIGNDAFYKCYSLTNAIVGINATNIGADTFDQCTNLISVTIPTTTPSVLFAGCNKLAKLIIANGSTSIGGNEFSGFSRLTTVSIPNSVTNIGSSAFFNCTSLTNVYFQGNAPTPTNASSVFSGDNNTTVYYLPGTTGWSATFDSRPTVLWNPQAQNDASFGVQNNEFGFNIAGSSNLVIVVEACTNFSNPVWQPVQTNTLTGGSSYFSDSQWTNFPARFYRFCSP